jgi:hypothetical protein
MGALVGALHASAPREDAEARFRALARAYEAETRREAERNGIGIGLLFGVVATLASGGAALPALAAGAGYALGAGGTERLEQGRLVRVMDEFFDGRRIEALPLPFVAFYLEPRGTGASLVAARAGGLAQAVGGSVANPLLFPGLDVARAARLDPGADRAAAVPVEDACRLFPGSNVLAINVSGHAIFHSAEMRCPLREVRVPPPGLDAEEALRFGPAYERAVAAGYAAARAALADLRD